MFQTAVPTGSPRSRLSGMSALRWIAWPLAILLLGLGLHVAAAPAAHASGVDCDHGTTISDGTVTLGVNCVGDLGTDHGSGTGLYYDPTGSEAVTQGCSCEGWGVADLTSGVSGYANETDHDDGSPGTSSNLHLVSFNASASTAVSVVDIGSTFRVTQDFHPSPTTPNLYEVAVSVTNTSGAATHLRYRRVMDWDIEPTPQREFVTLQQGTSPRIAYTSDDGFASSDPLAGPTRIDASGSFDKSGPDDHGALFDFDFGTINAGATRQFKIFYGAADNKTHADAALNSVNAEAYSYGQPDLDPDIPSQGPTTGEPNTFIFAFKDIDGSALFAPFAVGDYPTVYTATATDIDVLANDSDPNGDPLTIETAKTTQPSHGSVTCTTTKCTYTSVDGYVGPDEFTYTISDGNGGEATATVAVDVVPVPVNHAPVAVDDSATIDEDTSAGVHVLTNDTDQDATDVLTVSDHTTAAHGTVACTSTVCTYTPNADWNGTDSFDYTVSDGHSGGTDTGTVTVHVRAVNDAPVAVADPLLVTDEDTPKTVDLAGNDTDADGDTLAAKVLAQPAHGTVTCSGASCTFTPNLNWSGTDSFSYRAYDGTAYSSAMVVSVRVDPVNDAPVANDDTLAVDEETSGSVSVLSNDTDVEADTLSVSAHTDGAHGMVSCTSTLCTYTPAALYHGTDTFTYTVSDGHGGTAVGHVAVTVRRVDHAPVAVADTATTTEDHAVTVDVTANDTDADNPKSDLVASVVATAAHGTVTCTGGSCTYTPAANWNGADNFSYQLSDGEKTSNVARVDVTVTPVNDAPVVVDDSLAIDEDTSGSVSVLVNDSDVDGDALTVSAHTDGAHGTVTCTSTACTYTPAPDWNGADSFTYTADDGHGGTTVGTVRVTVRPVDDAPVSHDDTAATDEDTAVAIDVLANDTDIDNPASALRAILVTGASHGTVTCSVKCTYTPNANWNGADSFTYRTSDGTLNSGTARVDVTVRPVNDAPVAVDDSASATAGVAKTVSVLANDSDVDGDTLAVSAHGNAGHGSVSCDDTTCTYTADNAYAGTDSFTYTVADGHGGTATATVRMSVSQPNRAPVANADTISAGEDHAATLNVLTNDTDPDGDSLSLVTASTTQPDTGSVTCTSAGSCAYTPPANWSGSASYTYTVSDGHGHTAVGTVTVTITPVNDAPVPGADKLTVDRDRSGTVSVLVNDNDVDGDPLTVTKAVAPSGSTATCTTAGVCTFTPKSHWAGSTSFTYTVSDGTTTATGTVAVTVRATAATPDAPTIGKPSGSVVKKKGKRYNAKVTWKAPAWNGGSAITGYVVTVNKMSGSTIESTTTYTASKSATYLRLVLPTKVSYTFQVAAENTAGTGALSKTSKVLKTK